MRICDGTKKAITQNCGKGCAGRYAQNYAHLGSALKIPPRKGQSKIGLSQKTDIPNFGEMCPVLDRSMRRRDAQKAIGQNCPKPPSGGEAAEKRHMQAVNGP